MEPVSAETSTAVSLPATDVHEWSFTEIPANVLPPYSDVSMPVKDPTATHKPHGKPHATGTSAPDFPPSSLLQELLNNAQGEAFLPAGWSFSVYDTELQHHYTIPSQSVTATAGSLKYCTYHEIYGHGTRFRFQLCNKFVEGRCSAGKKCNFIHALYDTTSSAKSVHVNENLSDCNTAQDVVNSQHRPLQNTQGYRTLSDNLLIAVHAPNAHDEPPQLIFSCNLLVTKGSLQAFEQVVAQVRKGQRSAAPSSVPPHARPRHCAHFQFRKMCNLGEECHFIHSLAPYVQPKYRRQGDGPVPPHTTQPPSQQQPSMVQVGSQPGNRQMLPGDFGAVVPQPSIQAPQLAPNGNTWPQFVLAPQQYAHVGQFASPNPNTGNTMGNMPILILAPGQMPPQQMYPGVGAPFLMPMPAQGQVPVPVPVALPGYSMLPSQQNVKPALQL
jgi:hypothetical protein